MKIAPQFQRYLDSSYSNLDIDIDELDIADPPKDDSHTTRMELEELDRIVQEARLPRDIMQVADRDPLRLFYSVAKKKGLDPLEEEAKLWADDWTKLSFEFKLKFKRRRPYEVKKEHDVDFAHHKTDTTESPSYPSGHAMMAYGVAEFYKDKYPLMAGEWDNVADIISHSRLQMGVHYPSDVEASKSIVRQVAEQTKEASYARLARTVTQKRKLPIGRFKRKPTAAPAAAPAPAPAAAPTPQTWGQKAKGWASQNPTQATAAVGAMGLGGYMEVKKFTQPKPQPMGMPKMGSLGHLEQRRSERAKFMSKEELLKLEKQVRNTKGLPDGSHYITLPHGRKGVVRTEEGRSHLATILDARMRPPGRDLTKLVKSSSGHSKEARALFSRLANMARTTPTGTAIEIYGRQAGKGLRRGAQRGIQKGTQAARGVYTSPKLFNASYFVQKHLKPEMADDIGGVVNLIKGGSLKTAAEKLRLYHGSPLDLETLEPRQPNKGAWGEPGIYGSTDPLVAALYAIARNDSRGSWGVLPDGRLIAKSKKELNPEGYVYEYESDDYIPPPEDDPGIGYATQSSPAILNKEKVYLDQLRDSITRVDDRDKFLEYFKKTSSEQPLLRHRSTLLIRDPETGKLLAAKEPANSKASSFYFPGGGLYDDEYDTPRNPSDEDIIEGARREALEELGIELDNPRVVGSYGQELEDWWKEKTLKNRGVPYLGGHEHYVLADKGKENRSLYNVEGDAFEQGDYYDPKEIVEALSRVAKGDSTFAPFNREQVRAIKDNLLTKTSSIDLLTGRMGAGKSTLLNKLRDQYDIVEGTDLGSVVDGKFVEPSDEDKPRLRQEKADRLLAAHKAGKRVLMEGYPPGLFRIPGMVEAADRAVILEPDLLQRLMQIGNRSKERGTSIEEDIRFAVSPEHSAKEQKYLDMLRESITGTHIAPTSEAAEEYLLKKNASDLSVLTAVPKQNLDLIMRKGLYSQKAMLADPEVLAAFLAQRNADKAWKNDEQYDEKRFKEQYDKRVELMEGNDAPLSGPSVFFTEPDPDKVSDPRHFVNKFDTQKLRVNLGKLLADIPETRITGAELIPSSAAENMSDEEFEQYVKDRRRDITPEEAAKYIATDPKELWKHYKDEYLGRFYAADVPHAFIRTPSGIIPPEYLERVEKTSSAKEQLKHILVKKAALEDEFQPDLTPDDLKALGVYDQVYGDAPSEASMKEWPEHWINPQDPLGWLQWYDRYSGGRRTEDDARQIKRWKSFKARHLAQYLKKPTPRRAAALRNWGIDVEKY